MNRPLTDQEWDFIVEFYGIDAQMIKLLIDEKRKDNLVPTKIFIPKPRGFKFQGLDIEFSDEYEKVTVS